MLVADEEFSQIDVRVITTHVPERGFSSVKEIPTVDRTRTSAVVALRSAEDSRAGTQTTCACSLTASCMATVAISPHLSPTHAAHLLPVCHEQSSRCWALTAKRSWLKWRFRAASSTRASRSCCKTQARMPSPMWRGEGPSRCAIRFPGAQWPQDACVLVGGTQAKVRHASGSSSWIENRSV